MKMVFGTACAMLLAGCVSSGPKYNANSVKYADDVGLVTISPISVSRWEDVADSLKPNFKIDAAGAFAQAMPVTQTFAEQFVSRIGGRAAVGLPTTFRTSTNGFTTDAETGERVSIDSEETVEAKGALDSLAVPDLNNVADIALTSPSDAPGNDPMLKYLAATALLQEVRMLNRYIDDVIKVNNGQAFLVRLQLAMIPNARNMPYDAVTDITMHADDVQEAVGFWQGKASQCVEGVNRVHVMPMIVTDNLENLRASRSSEVSRQLALALLGTINGVGVKSDVEALERLLTKIEGSDTNSLLSVSRINDSTVRVRLGAALSPQSEYSAIARNHNISLMVIYEPCEKLNLSSIDSHRVMSAVARSSFIDARNGKKLPAKNDQKVFLEQAAYFNKKYAGDPSLLELASLYRAAMRQDWTGFFNLYSNKYKGEKDVCNIGLLEDFYARVKLGIPLEKLLYSQGELYQVESLVSADIKAAAQQTQDITACDLLNKIRYQAISAGLYTDLIGARPTGEFSVARIPFKLRVTNPLLFGNAKQTPLIETTTNASSVTILGGQDLDKFGDLTVKLVGKATNNKEVAILASDVKVSKDRKALTATFKPVTQYGWSTNTIVRVEVTGVKSACPNDGTCERLKKAEFDAIVTKPTSATTVPTYNLSSSAKAVVWQPGGKGSLRLKITEMENLPNKASFIKAFTVDGADVVTISGLKPPSDLKTTVGKSWVLTDQGNVVLELANLVPNQIVQVTATDDKGGKSSISRAIIAVSQQQAKTN